MQRFFVTAGYLLLGLIGITVEIKAALQTSAAGLRLIIVATEAEANGLLTRLQAGEKFEDLARVHSSDRSASAGGYLGTFAPSQLRPEFQAALAGLQPGQVSPVIRLGKEFALLQWLTDGELGTVEKSKAASEPSSRTLQQLWAATLARNSLEAVKELLAKGTPANVVYDDGSTILMGAAQDGQTEIVRALLAAK